MTQPPTTPSKPAGNELGSKDSFRLLVETVKDYAIVMLDPSGHVASWNTGAERIKGYEADEIIGKHFSCFYPADALRRGLPAEELRVAATEGRFEDEGWRVRKNGTHFWANVIISPLRDEGGTLQGFAKVTRDLTERKKAEERVQQQSREIMELSTPIMQVWQGVVVAPLIGSLDSQRTQLFMEHLLDRIVDTKSAVALVDIMGVPAIDTQTAQHLIETVSAVRLLGAQVVLTGVRPAIAQTLVHLGIDMSGIVTRSSLSAGLLVALDLLNLQVVSKCDSH
ncbi:MAG: PAS domain S-box protein [Candidatus Latescibacteria bacterium]|nr:PAS domain S-box protein [Candidatus Latescibacterota bacterium]